MTDQPLTSSPNELHTISAMSTEESKDEGLDSPAQFRAAEYVRMSTEHQQYSTETQCLQNILDRRAHGDCSPLRSPSGTSNRSWVSIESTTPSSDSSGVFSLMKLSNW